MAPAEWSPHVQITERHRAEWNSDVRAFVTSTTVVDPAAVVFAPHDTVLLFDGQGHWESFVPRAPPVVRQRAQPSAH